MREKVCHLLMNVNDLFPKFALITESALRGENERFLNRLKLVSEVARLPVVGDNDSLPLVWVLC